MWERLETFVLSWINARVGASEYQDEAWQELEEYLQSGPPPVVSRPEKEARLPREIRQSLFDLELNENATKEEIRDAYRRLLREYHPDRFHNDNGRSHTASEVTQRLSLAYRRLNDYYRY
ncbi:MAG: J domain-containing protein [Alkalispirochaeta sp.]|jgi:DnaJ-domain-containing protein 1